MNRDELPAVLGGVPAFPQGPPGWPPFWPDVQHALQTAFHDGSWGQYYGPHVEAFEAELSRFFSIPHVLTCASGTLAVEVALRAAGVGPGDEVILSAYDYESNFLTIHSLGARPVLIEVDPASGNMDPDRLEAACSPKTKAILASHLHGGLVPMPEVCELARKHSLFVVEDAAQETGAIISDRRVASWGDAGTLSFGGSKLLSAGRGGAILFQDAKAYQRAKLWLRRGVQLWAPLSELQALVLRPQLMRLESDARHRHEQVLHLGQELQQLGIAGLKPFQNRKSLGRPDYYKVGFWLDIEMMGLDSQAFVRAMRAEGVAMDQGFKPLHLGRSPSRFRAASELNHARMMKDSCVKLHHPILSEPSSTAMECIARAVWKVYRNADLVRHALSLNRKDAP